MKWFFIFLTGIIVVFTAFFAGMYIDSRDASVATATIDIEAEPETVFKWVTEPRKLTRWIQRLKSSKRLSQDDLIVGSLYEEKTGGAKGSTYTWSTQVKALQTDKRFVINSTMRTQKGKYDEKSAPVDPNTATVSDIRSEYVLTKTANGTRLTKSVTASFDKWYMTLFANVAQNAGVDAITSDLERLKTKIEADQTAKLKKKLKKKKKKKSPSIRPDKNAKKKKAGKRKDEGLLRGIRNKLEPKTGKSTSPLPTPAATEKPKFKLAAPLKSKPVVNDE